MVYNVIMMNKILSVFNDKDYRELSITLLSFVVLLVISAWLMSFGWMSLPIVLVIWGAWLAYLVVDGE